MRRCSARLLRRRLLRRVPLLRAGILAARSPTAAVHTPEAGSSHLPFYACTEGTGTPFGPAQPHRLARTPTTTTSSIRTATLCRVPDTQRRSLGGPLRGLVHDGVRVILAQLDHREVASRGEAAGDAVSRWEFLVSGFKVSIVGPLLPRAPPSLQGRSSTHRTALLSRGRRARPRLRSTVSTSARRRRRPGFGRGGTWRPALGRLRGSPRRVHPGSPRAPRSDPGGPAENSCGYDHTTWPSRSSSFSAARTRTRQRGNHAVATE